MARNTDREVLVGQTDRLRTCRRAALCAALVIALGGCEKFEQLVDPQPTAQPQPASAPAGQPGSTESAAPTVLPGEMAIIHQLVKWDGASRPLKLKVANEVALRTAGIEFKGLETFSSGGVSREVALFTHEQSGLEFSLIPGGTFKMGSPGNERGRLKDEGQHSVTISKGFLLSRTEVTQAAYSKIMGENLAKWKGDQLPAETVSHVKAAKYARKTRGKIPTEAQWEWACRAGTTTAYSFGKSEKDLDAHGWHSGNSGETTHPVAQKQPNAFGLYDMHGNVWEWTSSGHGDYPGGSVTDPLGDKNSNHKAARGGNFIGAAPTHRSAFRSPSHTSDKHEGLGIRLLKELKVD